MTDDQARAWSEAHKHRITAKIIKAKTLADLQALERSAGHEMDATQRRMMQERAMVLRRGA